MKTKSKNITLIHRLVKKFGWINVYFVHHYQTAELQQSRWTNPVIVVSRCVSMGTGASLPPEVFVVVDGVKCPVAVNFRATFGDTVFRFSVGEGLDQVNLILDPHKPPVAEDGGNFVNGSQTRLSSWAHRSHRSSSCILYSVQPTNT